MARGDSLVRITLSQEGYARALHESSPLLPTDLPHSIMGVPFEVVPEQREPFIIRDSTVGNPNR